MPDRADLDPALQQPLPRGLKVRNNEIDIAKRTGARVCESLADLDRAVGARRSHLHHTERVVRRIVDVEREAGLVDIEPQRPIDIAHRQRNHFD